MIKTIPLDITKSPNNTVAVLLPDRTNGVSVILPQNANPASAVSVRLYVGYPQPKSKTMYSDAAALDPASNTDWITISSLSVTGVAAVIPVPNLFQYSGMWIRVRFSTNQLASISGCAMNISVD